MKNPNINIVLYEPEIPQNTGNIIRTCMALGATLHIIEPMGFVFDSKRIKRSGMDYIDDVDIRFYDDYEDFLSKIDGKIYFITRYGKHRYDLPKYELDDKIYLMFGKESSGIPLEILRNHQETCLRIPMVKQARSLNLSNCVALVAYEVFRHFDYESLSEVEVIKGEDWINQG